MRGVQWDPQRGLRCADCGGYEVELLDGGLARCRSCGRTSVPTRTRRLAGTGRVMFTILGLFFILLGVEVAAVWIYTWGSASAFLRTFSVLAFFTGLAMVVVAGAGAFPGRVALGNARLDRLGRMYPVEDPVVMDTLFTEGKGRVADEPGALGLAVLATIGAALILLGYAFGFA